MALTEDQEWVFFGLNDAFRRYGYFIEAEPIEGMEDLFLADLKEAFGKVEQRAADLRRLYGYRGISRNLLEHLHTDFPCPSWNVDSAVAQELRAKWNRRRK